MKNYFCSLIVVFFISCNDNEKKSTSENQNPYAGNSELKKTKVGGNDDIGDENDPNHSNQTNPAEGETSLNGFSGLFKKVETEHKVADCNCYCLDLVFGSNFELCLVPDKIDIMVLAKKTGETTADIYFVEPVKSQNQEREIPWDSFSRNMPVAKLEYSSNGSLKLDWIGFFIDGELAVDYAIFGKKTLEGTYKKHGS